MGYDFPGKIIERILLLLAIVFIVAFVMASRHSQTIQYKEGVGRMHDLNQRVDDQISRLESVEKTLTELNKKPEPPAIVENEPYTTNTYMPVGSEFSTALK